MANQLDPRMIDSSKSATTLNATRFVSLSGNSDLWDSASSLVQSNSALWEETLDISSVSASVIPTVTNFLSTNRVFLSSGSISSLTATNLTVLSSNIITTTYIYTTADSLTSNEVIVNNNLFVNGQILSAGVDLFNIFLTTETDTQTLSFDNITKDLTISNGNTISLSALVDSSIDTGVRLLTSNWESTYYTVCALSASWEESGDILPTVTNHLSTSLVTVSSLNVTEQLLSANNDLFNLFLTPNNTLTTSICAMSGDGITPFVMQFTNGLLTTVTV